MKMPQKPTLQTVASKAGVSIATVSQVLRETGRISAKTQKKVMDAVKALQYVPDGRAASMRSGQTREIGMIIHFLSNPFNAELISGVSDTLEKDDYLVSVLDSQDDVHRQRRNLEAFIRSSRGGLLWVPAANTPLETLDLLKTHRLPVVTFLRGAYEGQFDHVGIQNENATLAATDHLINLGHSKIAYFGGIGSSDTRLNRIDGYKKSLQNHGLSFSLIWDAKDDKVSGLNAMLHLRQEHPEVTAIVCNGDVVALGACHALRRLGQMPGNEVSVIGFDDIQDASTATPPLSTVAIEPYNFGVKLAQVLIHRLKEPASPTATTLLPYHLKIRDTARAVRNA
jgi:LacI family transcriptional regulator